MENIFFILVLLFINSFANSQTVEKSNSSVGGKKYSLNSSIADEFQMYFCPSGKLISSTPSNIEKDLKENCQCPCCDKYDFSRNDLDCSGGGLGDLLASNKTVNALWACKIHDLCYETEGTSSLQMKKRCDGMFWWNIMQLCPPKDVLGIDTCRTSANLAWEALKNFGNSAYNEYWAKKIPPPIKCEKGCKCGPENYLTTFDWENETIIYEYNGSEVNGAQSSVPGFFALSITLFSSFFVIANF